MTWPSLGHGRVANGLRGGHCELSRDSAWRRATTRLEARIVKMHEGERAALWPRVATSQRGEIWVGLA